MSSNVKQRSIPVGKSRQAQLEGGKPMLDPGIDWTYKQVLPQDGPMKSELESALPSSGTKIVNRTAEDVKKYIHG